MESRRDFLKNQSARLAPKHRRLPYTPALPLE
jgi:hypothetical protein